MGPGILIRHTKKVLGGIVLAMLVLTASAMYGYLRGPDVSPYKTVNDLYDWEYMTFTADRAVYPAATETVELTFRNNASDGVVVLGDPSAQWFLEIWADGAWRSLRPVEPGPSWRFREEDCTERSVPSGVVDWDGGELVWYCDLGRFYQIPLEPGRYRIVIPDCEHMNDTADLAVEFEVV